VQSNKQLCLTRVKKEVLTHELYLEMYICIEISSIKMIEFLDEFSYQCS
jgi:hypothetical protein